MMQAGVSDVLNNLKSLSDSADLIIYEHNRENDQVDKWFSVIKETAKAIINGTTQRKSGRSSTFEKVVIPNLVTEIEGKHSNAPENRVSTLLAEVQKDRVRHINRKSRASLRKLILAKNNDNNSKFSNPEIKVTNNKAKLSYSNQIIPDINNETKTLEQHSKNISRALSNIKEAEKCTELIADPANQKENAYSTPVQDKEILAPDTDETPATRLRTKKIAVTQVVKKKKNVRLPSNNNQSTEIYAPEVTNKTTPSSETPVALDVKASEKSSKISNSMVEVDSYSTPLSQTIVIDSASSEKSVVNNKTPPIRSKRKSSVQLTRENALLESQTRKHGKPIQEDYGTRASKRIKMAKNASNAVIQPKMLGNTVQQNSVQSEKRILREIQKKEERVSQNTKKLKSLRQIKIEENKKMRELKMEKAMQQRIKMEKEKEERMRCRTYSKQENVQQKDSAVKRTAQKRIHHEEKVDSIKKINSTSSRKISPTSTKKISPISSKKKPPRAVKSHKEENETVSPKKAPPKPVRTPVKKTKPSPCEESTKDIETPKKIHKTFNLPADKELSVVSKEIFAKPSPLNATFISKVDNLTSTPAAKKMESKISQKTPISNSIQKPNSYTMTPSESSFVSYDVSEIKSDDSDEEESNNKPIPSWASGVRLRNALLHQQYNPINTDEMFGNYFGTPNLAAIMGVQKKHYIKRTSSAVWINSPNRSLLS